MSNDKKPWATKEEITTILAGVGAFTLVIGYVSVSLAWRGFVLSKLWAWHIEGVLHEAALTIPTGIALLILAQILLGDSWRKLKQTSEASNLKVHSTGWAAAGLALLVGWIIHVAL